MKELLPQLQMALSRLHTPEVKAKLDVINELDDFEQQGYESAVFILQAAEITPETLLEHMVRIGSSGDSDANVKRNIGVIRWCLDQRSKR